MLEELKVAKLSERPLGSTVSQALKKTLTTKIVTSPAAGLGKSDYIRSKAVTKYKLPLARCPLYGEMKKAEIIDLLNERVGPKCVLHLDVYPMNEESIHCVLFEILVLRKFHWRYEKFCIIPESIHIYVEVANTFANRLHGALSYLEHF